MFLNPLISDLIMTHAVLLDTIRELTAPGKGVLALDESSGTVSKRLAEVGISNATPEIRREYREMLLSPGGLSEYIAGTILFDETIRQTAKDRRPFSEMIRELGIIPGIKVDRSTHPLPGGYPGEVRVEGLDGLAGRLEEYSGLGARFTKWRGVVRADNPSQLAIDDNAQALAIYAAHSIAAGLVPFVEPEVLVAGTHTIGQMYDATKRFLAATFEQLHKYNVDLRGVLIKTNMVTPGLENPNRASHEEIAKRTIECFSETIPHAMPGVMFLSGGQTDDDATYNLNALNRDYADKVPWQLGFSYGRGLHRAALGIWADGQRSDEATIKAQAVVYERAELTSKARKGELVV